MAYKDIATKIKTNLGSYSDAINAIDISGFNVVWYGDAHDNLISQLDSTKSLFSQCNTDLNGFVVVLEELQQYKENKEKISSLQSSLAKLDGSPENNSNRESLRSSINKLVDTNNSLKTSINSYLNSVKSINAKYDVIDFEPTKEYMDYIVDLGSLYSLFANNSLSQISSSSSLYDYYSRDTVYERISEIKNQYSGRQAAVNCALGIIDMAASVGKKLNYELLRGTNDLLTIDKLVTGSDCVSFASWAISQGSEKVTKTFSTQEFVNLGTKIDSSQAQVGDVFTLKYADRGGHVMLVVENHPEQGSCLVAEAGGENRGVVLTEIKYSVLQDKKYTARDLTEFYI
jgi:hypothetical protein